ncbi:MAG TPA: hypothetical protein VF576_12380 [Rubricoccaceae bacterium]|jgi:hypothetical protein
MATIPVEKKSGTPWWMWLLPLLLLGLLFYVFTRDNDDQVAADETTQAPTDGAGAGTAAGSDTDALVGDTATGAAAGAAAGAAGAAGAGGAAITNVDDLYGENLASLVGRRVEIDDATVLSVPGDSSFFVGSGGRRFLVALSGLGETATGPGDEGADGRFNIDAGDRVSIRGTVTPFDANNRFFSSIPEADRSEMTTRGAFVNVTRMADVTSR